MSGTEILSSSSSNNLTDHDLLIRLEVKVNILLEEFRRTSNGTGFPRCAERLGRLVTLEEDFKQLSSKCWWAVTTAIVSLGGLLGSLLMIALRNGLVKP
jgi:hypothetical protein